MPWWGVSLRTARQIVKRFIAERRDPAPADPAANEVSLAPKRNGRWSLHGDLDEETARVIVTELRRLAEGHRDDDGLCLARRMALGLLDMTRRSIPLGERGPGSRPEVVLVAHVGLDGDSPSPAMRMVFRSAGRCREPLLRRHRPHPDRERAVRTARPRPVNAACHRWERRAVAVRDGGCVPGCDQPPEQCDLHHIRHWLHGGATDTSNLCLLCRRHHTVAHVIGFTFARDHQGQLTIYRPDGTPLGWFGRQAA